MTRAYVETTVLTNVLLKSGTTRDVCAAALRRYDATQTPGYAIKEFSAGPLSYFIWCHNKLKMSGSVPDTMAAIKMLFATPGRNRASTALEALTEAMRHVTADKRFGELADKYGRSAEEAGVFADRHRYWLRGKIQRAWSKRRSVCVVFQEVPCFNENPPNIDDKGLLGPRSWKCSPSPECSLAPALKADLPTLKKLRDATLAQPPKPENQKRLTCIRRESPGFCSKVPGNRGFLPCLFAAVG